MREIRTSGLMSGDWKRNYGTNCDTGMGESRRQTVQPRSLRPPRQSSTLLAMFENKGWPPRVVRGEAFHPAIASSLNQTVRLPRCRRVASYSAQFVTRRFARGI